jgi:hypothetical protein
VAETVAIVVLPDVQGVVAFGVPEPSNVVVEPIHVFKLPVIVGDAKTLTETVTVQFAEFLYVIFVVPTKRPETKPVAETVATVGADDTHGAVVAAVAEPVNCVDEPIQVDKVPVTVGAARTVTTAVLVQLFEFV